MMDRHTVKKNHVFVEVRTANEVVSINQFDKHLQAVRHPKISYRGVPAMVTVVSQPDFMAALFLSAKNVEWCGPVPRVSDEREYYYGVLSSGSEGFLRDKISS